MFHFSSRLVQMYVITPSQHTSFTMCDTFCTKMRKMIYILSCNRLCFMGNKCKGMQTGNIFIFIGLTCFSLVDRVIFLSQCLCEETTLSVSIFFISEQWAGDISGQEKLKGFSRPLLKKFSLRWHLSCPTKTRPVENNNKKAQISPHIGPPYMLLICRNVCKYKDKI